MRNNPFDGLVKKQNTENPLNAYDKIIKADQKIQSTLIDAPPTKLKIDELSEKYVMEDLFETTVDDIDQFEEDSWKKGTGYKLPKFKGIEENLEGLEAGLYLLAAESNVGKSAVMMNIMHDACTCIENKLFGIYLSLDDSKKEIIPRVVAMQQNIPISVVSKPQRYKNMLEDNIENASVFQEYLDKRKEGLERLKIEKELFKIVDRTRLHTADEIHQFLKQAQAFVRTKLGPEHNIIIAIDSINDIQLPGFQGTEKNEEVARIVKGWAGTLDIVIFCSCHLRKLNQNRRPTLDDLKDAVVYQYEASMVWLLYNDVSKNKQAAKVFNSREGVTDKFPVIEMDWAKNKKSSYKGYSFLNFNPDRSRCIEANKEASKRFEVLVYSQ